MNDHPLDDRPLDDRPPSDRPLNDPPLSNRPRGFMTRAIHGGYDRGAAMGALIPPIHMTSTYAFDTSAESEAVAAGELLRPLYGP